MLDIYLLSSHSSGVILVVIVQIDIYDINDPAQDQLLSFDFFF